MASASTTLSREEVRFRSGDDECAGVLFQPETDAATPCVVLAHGFGAVKEGGPTRVAERYAEAGFAALAFDYRHFGESGGEPRQLLDIGRQHEDYRAAIGFARELERVDPDRIALWGSSFSGGHVVAVAAGDPRIAAVVSQAPHMDGIATLRSAGPASVLRLTFAGLIDQVGALSGREPHMLPIVGPPGTTAAMTSPDALPGYRSCYDDGFEWRNEVAGRVALWMATYRPGLKAASVRCPLLVQVAADDVITPPAAALEAAARAPRGKTVTYAGLGHFGIYRGEAYERAVSDQLEFLNGHLCESST